MLCFVVFVTAVCLLSFEAEMAEEYKGFYDSIQKRVMVSCVIKNGRFTQTAWRKETPAKCSTKCVFTVASILLESLSQRAFGLLSFPKTENQYHTCPYAGGS